MNGIGLFFFLSNIFYIRNANVSNDSIVANIRFWAEKVNNFDWKCTVLVMVVKSIHRNRASFGTIFENLWIPDSRNEIARFDPRCPSLKCHAILKVPETGSIPTSDQKCMN